MKCAADRIRTQRLQLARLGERDAGLMLTIWNDPDFIRFVGDRGIRTEQEALKALQDGALKQWSDLGYGAYRIEKLCRQDKYSQDMGAPFGLDRILGRFQTRQQKATNRQGTKSNKNKILAPPIRRIISANFGKKCHFFVNIFKKSSIF